MTIFIYMYTFIIIKRNIGEFDRWVQLVDQDERFIGVSINFIFFSLI